MNVPLPRRAGKSKVPTESWRPGGGSAAAVDPRKATRNLAKERTVPTVRRARSERAYSRIDFVERKKTTAVIQGELDDARMRTGAYRPAHVRPIGESEKERFGEICAYKGGKILPKELTGITLDVMPHERAAKAKEAERIRKVRRRRAGLPEEDPEEELARLMASQAKTKGNGGGQKAALAEQLGVEIEERRQYLADLEQAGEQNFDAERRIAMEISQRVGELRRVDPKAAEGYGGDAVASGAFQMTRASAPFFRE